MSNVSALGYIGVGVRDLDAWTTFASEVLGMQTTRGQDPNGEDTLFLRMDERHHRIAVRTGEDTLQYVGWEVSSPRALDALARQLDDVGVACQEDEALAARRGVHRLITCSDPAGTALEFFTGPLVPKEEFRSPTGVEFVTKDPSGRDLGFGHIVMTAPDIDAVIPFYLDVLGFRLSDHIVPIPGLLLTFAHVNPRHHSLALAPARPGSTGAQLDHFMVEVRDIDGVGRALDVVRSRGLHLNATLGRHSNDKMISFYVKSPSGFGVEYGTDGLLIDDETWTAVTYDVAAVWGHEFHH